MHTEYLVVDDDTQSKEIKHIRKVVPDVGIAILPRALCVEPVGLRHPPRFMVPPYQMYAMWVSKF